jgi:hypothetical protein
MFHRHRHSLALASAQLWPDVGFSFNGTIVHPTFTSGWLNQECTYIVYWNPYGVFQDQARTLLNRECIQEMIHVKSVRRGLTFLQPLGDATAGPAQA